MTSRRTQHEPIMTQQLTGTPIQMSSRRSNQIWVEHTKYQYRLNKLDAQLLYASSTIFSLEDQMFIEITALHLYVKSNSSPLREVQTIFRYQFLRNPNSFILAAPPKGYAIMAAYVPSTQGIKPFVVHPGCVITAAYVPSTWSSYS